MKGFLYGQTEYNMLKNSARLNDYLDSAVAHGFDFLSLTDDGHSPAARQNGLLFPAFHFPPFMRKSRPRYAPADKKKERNRRGTPRLPIALFSPKHTTTLKIRQASDL